MSKLIVSDWPPRTWYRLARKGAKERRWRDSAGEARLQDVALRENGSLSLTVSDPRGGEWTNTIQLRTQTPMIPVYNTLVGALGKRVGAIVNVRVVNVNSLSEVLNQAQDPGPRVSRRRARIR